MQAGIASGSTSTSGSIGTHISTSIGTSISALNAHVHAETLLTKRHLGLAGGLGIGMNAGAGRGAGRGAGAGRPEISASLRKKFVPPKRKRSSSNSNSNSSTRNSIVTNFSGGSVDDANTNGNGNGTFPLSSQSRKRPRPLPASTIDLNADADAATDVEKWNIRSTSGSGTSAHSTTSVRNPYAKTRSVGSSNSSIGNNYVNVNASSDVGEGTNRTPAESQLNHPPRGNAFQNTNTKDHLQQRKRLLGVVNVKQQHPQKPASRRLPPAIWNPYKKSYQFVRSTCSSNTNSSSESVPLTSNSVSASASASGLGRNTNGSGVGDTDGEDAMLITTVANVDSQTIVPKKNIASSGTGRTPKNPYMNKIKTPIRNPYMKLHQHQHERQHQHQHHPPQSKMDLAQKNSALQSTTRQYDGGKQRVTEEYNSSLQGSWNSRMVMKTARAEVPKIHTSTHHSDGQQSQTIRMPASIQLQHLQPHPQPTSWKSPTTNVPSTSVSTSSTTTRTKMSKNVHRIHSKGAQTEKSCPTSMSTSVQRLEMNGNGTCGAAQPPESVDEIIPRPRAVMKTTPQSDLGPRQRQPQIKPKAFSLVGLHTMKQSQKFLRPRSKSESQAKKLHQHGYKINSDTNEKVAAIYRGLSSPSARFQPVLNEGLCNHDGKKNPQQQNSIDCQQHQGKGKRRMQDINRRILPITHAAQKNLAAAAAVPTTAPAAATKSESHAFPTTPSASISSTKGKYPTPRSSSLSRSLKNTPSVNASGRPLLVGKRTFVRPVSTSRQKKRSLLASESKVVSNNPSMIHQRSRLQSRIQPHSHQKRRLFPENDSQSQSQSQSPQTTPLRKPYPFTPAPQAWLQGISRDMLQPVHRSSSKLCFLCDGLKGAKKMHSNAHAYQMPGDRRTSDGCSHMTSRHTPNTTCASKHSPRLVRVMGYVTSVPETIVIARSLEGRDERNGQGQELLSFMFDDGTSHIDALWDENSNTCSDSTAQKLTFETHSGSSAGESHKHRRVKISDRIDCIGYIQYQVGDKERMPATDMNIPMTPVFMIQSCKFVDDPSLETFRMMQILSQNGNDSDDERKRSLPAAAKMKPNPTLKNDTIIHHDGKQITCNVSILYHFIDQSKPDGLTEEDLALLFSLKGSQERSALQNGLKRLQKDFKIYQTRSGSYLTT